MRLMKVVEHRWKLFDKIETYKDRYYKDVEKKYRTTKDLVPGDGCCGYESKPIPAGTLVELYNEPVDNYSHCYVIRSIDGTMFAFDPYGWKFFDKPSDLLCAEDGEIVPPEEDIPLLKEVA